MRSAAARRNERVVAIGVSRRAPEAHYIRVLQLIHVASSPAHDHAEALVVGEGVGRREERFPEAVGDEAEAWLCLWRTQYFPCRILGG